MLLIIASTIVAGVSMAGFDIDPGISPAPFIGTLWQVQAAVVGFAVAVTIAAIEGMARVGAARVAFRTAFPASVNLGVGLVLLTGSG